MRPSAINRSARRVLRAGVVVGPLFIAVFSVDGATRRDYRARRHPVSSLALGPRGWLQTANFAVAGTVYVASAVTLRRSSDPALGRRTGPGLIATAATGIIGAAVFTTDPVSGYPAGTPDTPTTRTTAGILHDTISISTFLGLPLAQGVYAWGFARSGHSAWAAYSASTAAVMLGALGLSGAGFAQSPRFVDTAGLWQRVCIAAGFGWLTALNTRALSTL